MDRKAADDEYDEYYVDDDGSYEQIAGVSGNDF